MILQMISLRTVMPFRWVFGWLVRARRTHEMARYR